MRLSPQRVVGAGPTKIIAIHGWMGDHHLFDPFLDAIDRDRFTCAVFDCRGYGGRRDEPGDMTVEAIARDTVALADALGWQKFHCLGHSMGGMAAQRLMVDSPDRLRSTILVASVPASGAKINEERRELLLGAIADPAARRRLIDINTGGKLEAAVLDHILGISLAGTEGPALRTYMASWTGTDFAAEAKGSELPVLVIVGGRDPGATRAAAMSALQPLYPRAVLEEIAGSGHYPMQEAPAVLAALIAAYLADG